MVSSVFHTYVVLLLRTHIVHVKRPVCSCCLTWLLRIINKVSFESSEAGLFTSNNGNKAEVCAVLCAEKEEALAQMDSLMAWKR